MNKGDTILTFNSPLEAGIRSLCILTSAYPKCFDLQQLVLFDYIVVHTADLGGPNSLHPKLPLRSKEILVRRQLIEKGLSLMISRNLVEKKVCVSGFSYCAGDLSLTFLNSLSSPYLIELRKRAEWVSEIYSNYSEQELRAFIKTFFNEWIEEFQTIHKIVGI